MTAPAIQVTDLHVSYSINRNRPRSLKEAVLLRNRNRAVVDNFFALAGLNFQVEPGEFFAVIGANGAGKSTLMRVLARAVAPSRGRVVTRGRVAPMIELGGGFMPDLTGAENIVLYGTLLGRSPSEMRRRSAAIIEWAELQDFLHVPLRAFSSGMTARLAFSVATDVGSDILLVDEVLSVGDEAFQRKCEHRLLEAQRADTAVVLVTHDMTQVLGRAQRAAWLDKGELRETGAPADVVASFRQAQARCLDAPGGSLKPRDIEAASAPRKRRVKPR
jgi:ABC-type polysaccharide/polyol phosphate transport system ATPase subunit